MLPDWPATVQEHVNCPRKLSWPVARTNNVKAMGPDPLRVPVGTIMPARSKAVLPSAVRTGTTDETVVVKVPELAVGVAACAAGTRTSRGARIKNSSLMFFMSCRPVLKLFKLIPLQIIRPNFRFSYPIGTKLSSEPESSQPPLEPNVKLDFPCLAGKGGLSSLPVMTCWHSGEPHAHWFLTVPLASL